MPWTLHSAEPLVPLLAVLVLGVVGTGLAQWLQFDVVRAAGPTVATSVTYPITVVSVVLGVVILGEQLGPIVLLGGVVVLAASLLIGRGTRKPSPADSATARPTGDTPGVTLPYADHTPAGSRHRDR